MKWFYGSHDSVQVFGKRSSRGNRNGWAIAQAALKEKKGTITYLKPEDFASAMFRRSPRMWEQRMSVKVKVRVTVAIARLENMISNIAILLSNPSKLKKKQNIQP